MGLSYQTTGNEKVSMKEDEVVKMFKLKLSKGHGMTQNWHFSCLVISYDYNTHNSYSAPSFLLLFQKTLVLRFPLPHEK